MTSLADDVERVRAALMPPNKPSSLVMAEKAYAKLRAERAALVAREREMAQEVFRVPGAFSIEEMQAVKADIQILTEETATARRALDAERAKHGETFLQHVGTATIVGETLLVELLRHLDDLTTPYTDLTIYAAGNGLPTPRILAAAGELQALVRRMRVAMPRR